MEHLSVLSSVLDRQSPDARDRASDEAVCRVSDEGGDGLMQQMDDETYEDALARLPDTFTSTAGNHAKSAVRCASG